ncbi:MAG: hypothetical protein ACTHZ1_02715 [Sphingobacterium sp.]
MKTSIWYTRNIIRCNRYLFVSVPLIALIAYFGSFYLLEFNSIPLLKEALAVSADEQTNYKSAVSLATRTHFYSSALLVIFLPFLHLTFIQQLYYNPIELTLPIATWQRFASFLMVSTFVFILNLTVICGLNYALQLYLQHMVLDNATTGYSMLGYLYTRIPSDSILYNASANRACLTIGLFFFLLLPLYLIGTLYFSKYSRVKSTLIAIGFLVIGYYLNNLIWEGETAYINNEAYVSLFPYVIGALTSLLLYCGLLNLIKKKEI